MKYLGVTCPNVFNLHSNNSAICTNINIYLEKAKIGKYLLLVTLDERNLGILYVFIATLLEV